MVFAGFSRVDVGAERDLRRRPGGGPACRQNQGSHDGKRVHTEGGVAEHAHLSEMGSLRRRSRALLDECLDRSISE